jgi:sortase A
MDRTAQSPLWKGTEYCLWTLGFLILGYCTFVWLEGKRYQALGSRELDIRFARPRDNFKLRPPSQGQLSYAYGSLVGRLEIPRLGLSVIAFEGTDGPVLDRGAGHLIGSALPGDSGNAVFAAHRDTFFRELRNIHKDDVINAVTSKGTRRYRVESIDIVQPTQTAVLDPTAEPVLTLVTCYPFQYIGNAPQRFIVRARQVSLSSESSIEPELRPRPQPAPAAGVARPTARTAVQKRVQPSTKVAAQPSRSRKRSNPAAAIKRLFFRNQKQS